MHPAEHGSYVTLPARLSQWDFNYGPAIDGSIQMSDYQKDDRRQMNKRGMANMRKGYWRSADSPIVKLAISKERLKKAGYTFLPDYYLEVTA